MWFTDDQLEFRDTMRRVAAERVAPVAAKMDDTDEFPEEILKLFRELDLVQLAVPEAYGGPGGDVTTICIAREEIAKGGSMASATLAGQNNSLTLPVLQLGTDEQNQRFLPEFAKGEITCVAITEAEAGSSPADMKTKAVRNGDEWVINGTKVYITWGKLASYCIVFARTGSERGEVSGFIVPLDAPGLTEERHNIKLGQRGLPNVDLRFDDVRVPHESMLGPEGKGLVTALRGLHQNRPMMGAIALGGAQAAFDLAVDFLKNRVQNGRPLTRHQGLRWKLAEMATEIEAARGLIYRCAAEFDSGADIESVVMLSSMAKLYASETAVKVTNECVQLLGGAGYMHDLPAERYLRDARVTTIYEGTSEIQKNTIARELL
jgi:alkylation response protein AidB-like acyl-CoA dehydrogenase